MENTQSPSDIDVIQSPMERHKLDFAIRPYGYHKGDDFVNTSYVLYDRATGDYKIIVQKMFRQIRVEPKPKTKRKTLTPIEKLELALSKRFGFEIVHYF